jgi:archaemetzincin
MGSSDLRPEPAGARGAESPGLLVPIGAVDPEILEFLALILPETLGTPWEVAGRALPADPAFEPLRNQWNAAAILERLDCWEEGRQAPRILGVADVDLFIPILTFVLGLAHLGARAALISVHRMHPEFYGLPADPELVLRRIEKEALHELGHTLRLVHCADYACVMHVANTMDEVDLKEARFCNRCRREAGIP